jgi:osmotically-inducible protein OsmY
MAIGGDLLLSGCIPAAVVGTAAIGATSLRSERGVSGVFSDVDVLANIHQAFRDESLALYDAVSVTVKEGRVLLTGRVGHPDVRQRADAVARNAKVAQEILNEIQVGPPLSASRISSDAWLTTQAESALLFNGSAHSLNYKVTTVDSVLYVLGTSRTQFERESVLKRLRAVSGARRVVSYIRLTPLASHKKGPHHPATLEQPRTAPSAGAVTVRRL